MMRYSKLMKKTVLPTAPLARLIFSALLFFCTCTGLYSENTIANGDFEQQSKKPWTVQFAGDNQKNSELEAELDNTTFHSGKSSIRLKGKSAYLSSGSIRVLKNTKYRLSGWIKTFKVPRAEIRLTGKDKNNKPSGVEVSIGVSDTRNWTYNETVFDSGESETATIQLLLPSLESGTAWFDDIILEEGAKSQNANLLWNSSFTACTNSGIPDYWSVNAEALLETEDWSSGRYYGTDPSQTPPVKDVKVLRVCKPATSPPITLSSNNYIKLLPQGKYTLSAYMKADKNGLIVYGGGKDGKEKKLKISTEWKRYSFTTEIKGSDFFSLTLENPGTLWISAPQFEEGTETTPFSISAHDKIKIPEQSEAQYNETPSFQCAVTETPPLIDASLNDQCWKNASTISVFRDNESGKQVETGLQVSALRDNDNLYVAYKIPLRKSEKLKTEQSSMSENDIFKENSDIAELFISPLPSSNIYYHFAVNTSGKIYDAAGKNNEWQSGWNVKTARENDFFIVEASIPLNCLSLRREQPFCGVNFCLTHYEQGKVEYLSWTGKSSYHQPENFAKLTGLSTEKLKHLFWNIDNMQLKKDVGNSYTLSAWLSSESSSSGDFKCILDCPGLLPPFSAEKDFNIENGTAQITFEKLPENLIASGKILRMRLFDRDGKKTLASFWQTPSAISSPKLSVGGDNILSALLEFAHYTDSPDALLRVNWKIKKPVDIVIKETECGKPDGNGKIIKTANIKTPGFSYITIPIKELPRAPYKISVDALQDKKEIAAASDTLMKILPGPVDINVNRFKRCLFIDNMLSVNNYYTLPPLEKNAKPGIFLGQLKEQGFKTVLQSIPWDIEPGDKSLKDLTESCAENQIRVILKIDSAFKKKTAFTVYKEQTLKLINKLKDNPSIIAWYILDDLSARNWEKNNGFKETELTNLIDAVKDTDPLRPLIIGWDKNEFLNSEDALPYGFSNKIDICGITFFPFPATPLPELMKDFCKAAQKANEAAAICGRPVIFTLRTFGNNSAAHEPSPEALRFMSYINIICGTRLNVFDGNGGKPMYSGLWDMEKNLNSEFKYLAENVFSGDAKRITSAETTNHIYYAIWQNRDKFYIIAANRNEKATEFSMNLNAICPSPFSSFASPFEQSNGEIKNGILTEKLQPLQAKLYLLNTSPR